MKEITSLPFLKWAGGKRLLAPAIKAQFEKTQCQRLVEPFCGALSIALNVEPKNALLCDDHKALINLHQQVKNNHIFPNFNNSNNKSDFLALKAEFNDLSTNDIFNSRNAELFYYLNRTCFNGLCRYNKKGLFNVDFAGYKKPIIRSDFSDYSAKMNENNWELKCLDFKQTFELLNDKDYTVIDPPYDGGFIEYWKTRFKWEQQVELAELAINSAASCVLMNAATSRIIDLYISLGFVVFSDRKSVV